MPAWIHPRPHRARAHRCGFTIIEILVVLAIVGLVIGFSVNLLSQSMPKFRVENAARSLQALLYQARLTAMRRSTPVAVRFEPVEQRAVAFFFDSGTEIRTLDLRLDSATRFIEIAGPAGEPAIDGFTDLGAGELGAVFERDGALRDTGGVRFVYGGFADFLEVRAGTRGGVIEVLKYLDDADSPTGDAGFFPKANHPVTGAALWVWYGKEE